MKFKIKRLISKILIFFSANIGAFGLKTGFCYPFFYCNSCPTATSACPLRAIEQSVYKGSFKWRLLLFPIIILGFFGVTSGRAICGWGCPIGLLQRGTGKIARKIKIIYDKKYENELCFSDNVVSKKTNLEDVIFKLPRVNLSNTNSSKYLVR